MVDQEAKIDRFRRLHEQCFVLPNPWDRGSARFLAAVGFEALATTSAGLAFAMGRADAPGALPLSDVVDNIREIVEATELPVNADFQDGYGPTPDAVAENVKACVDAGVAGLSIEDACAGPSGLYSREDAVARLRAARKAIDASGLPVVLTGRAECFLVGHDDPLEESIARLTAYAEAGADCLYAPGLTTDEEIRAVVEAVAPKPVNVLAAKPTEMTASSLAALGVRRISVGSAMARVAWGAFMRSASSILRTGELDSLSTAEPFSTFNELFSDD